MTEPIHQYSTPDPIREFNTELALPDPDARQALREDGVVCLRTAHDPGWRTSVHQSPREYTEGVSIRTSTRLMARGELACRAPQ